MLDDVYASRTEEINAVNLAHDEDVANISKQHVVAEVANETVKADLIDDLSAAKDAGLDVSSLVEEAELPFDVDTDLKPDDVLQRIENREGEDIDAIKNDEEFDVFLARILQQFEDSKSKPDSPDAPAAPESEESPDRDDFVHEPENPGNPGSPDFRGDEPTKPSAIDVDTSVPYEPESPESPEALTNDFDEPVAPEAPNRPPSPESPKGRSSQPVVSIVSTKVVASDDESDMDDEDAPSCSLHKDEVEPETVRAFRKDAFKEVSTEECTLEKGGCDVEGQQGHDDEEFFDEADDEDEIAFRRPERPERPEGCTIDLEDQRPEIPTARGQRGARRPEIPRRADPSIQRPSRPDIPSRRQPDVERVERPTPDEARPDRPGRPNIPARKSADPGRPTGPSRPRIPARPARKQPTRARPTIQRARPSINRPTIGNKRPDEPERP